MRKQTKLVAVLSAAALLAVGASMTSFAGWEKDEDGIWHYYDSDDEMVEDEWRKDGSKWFYLDEDGNMLTDAWVDDDYYVGADGAMLKNTWIKTVADEDIDDPEEDGDHWYYFGTNGKKITDESKKINGKTYFFDEDGKMEDGWYEKNGEVYYLGEEDEGWRAESQWLWLERPGNFDEDDQHEEAANFLNCSNNSSDMCDDEGWYYFGSGGKLYRDASKKKVNGKYYFFNAHGQMLYEWINDKKYSVGRNDSPAAEPAPNASSSNASLDGKATTNNAEIWNMKYTNVVEDGSRADGWYEIDGSKDAGTDSDTDWYFFDNGEAKRADSVNDGTVFDEDGAQVYVARIKVDSSKGKKYFAFNEMGQMQTGLQYVPDDKAFYFFDENGYMKTGKVANVECDDDDYDFYFETKNGSNGKGVSGEKSGYLYFNGKKLCADDDYRLYFYNEKVYLVNTKGKIQKSDRKYDIENSSIAQDDVEVEIGAGNTVTSIKFTPKGSTTAVTWSANKLIAETLKAGGAAFIDSEGKYEDTYVSIPFIELYDNEVYTYEFTVNNQTVPTADWDIQAAESWYDVNEIQSNNTQGSGFIGL